MRIHLRMADTRVLIVTPLKGGISAHYSKTLIELLRGTIPGYEFGHVYMSGNCVFGARDWGAYQMFNEGWDGILWWDADLCPTTADFVRLLSHDADFVCGAYCGRDLTAKWHMEIIPNTETTTAGLWAVKQAAIGFSYTRKSLYEKMKARHPERTYKNREQGADVTQLHQFFPWQIIGPNSDMGKLERLKTFFLEHRDKCFNSTEALHEVEQIVMDNDYSGNLMQGEDYALCRQAREVGVPIWVDSKLIIPHLTELKLPVTHDQLIRMVAEPWRQDEWAHVIAERKRAHAQD